MDDKINSIDDIQSWEDIEEHIRTFYNKPENDFIILMKENDNYILMQKKDIENIKSEWRYNCYILPNYCLKDINYCTSSFAFSGFNSLPHYQIVYDLYRNKDNNSTYMLLWFTGTIYEILENQYYRYWFDECNNYNEMFLDTVLNHMLDICGEEIEKRLDISNYRYIFGSARKNFLPIQSIQYDYEYINKSLDVSNINIIIDYISLIIQEVKTQYRFVVIYE